MSRVPLSALPIGHRATVVDIQGDGSLAQRILELGLIPGTEVALIRRAPLGDPLEVEVLGYHLSLRRTEAAVVGVEVLP